MIFTGDLVSFKLPCDARYLRGNNFLKSCHFTHLSFSSAAVVATTQNMKNEGQWSGNRSTTELVHQTV